MQLNTFGDCIAISCLAISETPLSALYLCSIHFSSGISRGYSRIKVFVIRWPRSREFPKRKSRDNNHLELHPGQFDLHHNASTSRAPTRSRSSFSPYALVSLRTCLSMHSTLHRYVCVPAGKRFRLSIYLRSFTCRSMQFVILDRRSTRWGSWAVGWMQSTLLPCMIVSLVISIGRSNWLNDKRSPLACHQDNQSSWFDDEGPLSACHWSIQGSWLEGKDLTDANLQYAIRLASNGLMAKEWQNIYPSVGHRVLREAGTMTRGRRQISRSNRFDDKGLAKDCPSLQIRDRQRTVRSIDW